MAAIVNHTRTQGRYLQTPIRAYRNEAGRTVTLVALVHHGERRYFQAIIDIVRQRQHAGAAVHYESTGMTPQQVEDAEPTDAERKAIRLTTRRDETSLNLVSAWGWVDQLDGFGCRTSDGRPTWPDGWEQHDLRLIDVIRLQGVDQAITQLRAQCEQPETTASWLTRKITLTHLALSYWTDAKGVRPPKPTDTVILDRRNDKAITDADRQPRDDVVLLWGAAHLEGLETRLRQRGYTMVEETWHSVGRLPRLTSLIFWCTVGFLVDLRHLPQRIRHARVQYAQQRPYLAEVRKELADRD